MDTILDGQKLFDEQDLKIEMGSVGRDSIERTIGGLDGVVSIDLGGRSRKIKQRGVLRAKSRMQMDTRINSILTYMDGDTHTLVISDGEELSNVRMDAFRVIDEKTSGSGLCCDYEIVYTQLVA